jgi:hypothetical protein
MAKTKIHHFDGFSIQKAGIDIKLDMSRIEGNFNKAQYALDSAVMTSMVPFMPHRDGSFINKTRAESAALAGTGEVVAAAAPEGRFLYEGKVMVDPVTQSAWARKGAKKILTTQSLKYSSPKAQAHWFDAAKKKDAESWVRVVKNVAGGG